MVAKTNKDKVFLKNREYGDFRFDENVAMVFDDMLNRSVPMYQEIQHQICYLVNHFASQDKNIYDLGCSLWTTLNNIIVSSDKKLKCIGYDSSKSMIEIAKTQKKMNYKNQSTIEYKLKDITENMKYENAGIVIVCLTLQFIDPKKRNGIVKNIFKQLKDWGIVILVEKIVIDNNDVDKRYKNIYYDRKKLNGYSEKEIKEKEKALEWILNPYTYDQNIKLLEKNWFMVQPFFNWFNFAGFLWIKKIKWKNSTKLL